MIYIIDYSADKLTPKTSNKQNRSWSLAVPPTWSFNAAPSFPPNSWVDTTSSDDTKVLLAARAKSSSKNGIYAYAGNKDFLILIKKNQLAKEIENQRPARFVKGDKLDAIITELDKEKRKVSLSIKALEEKQTKEAVKKYGSKDSGGVLGEILGPLLKKKTKDKK